MNEPPSRIAVEFDAAARMRDGVVLRANIYRPDGAGPWPTLLTRTPYGKHVLAELAWAGLDPVQAARHGFMVVIQDTRGRFASEGEWDPFRFERQDGYDSVEWAARLQGSNGRVGLYGGSYCGNTQWMPAMDQPPSLCAISPLMTWSEPMDGLFARGGAVELGLAVMWSLLTGIDDAGRGPADLSDPILAVPALLDEWDKLAEQGYWELPVRDGAALRRQGVRELGSLRAIDDPSIADRCRVAGSYDKVRVPSLHTAGWHDIFVQGTLDNYEAMVERGHETRLVVGPWTHRAFADPIGERLYGIRADRDGAPMHADGTWSELQLAWFNRHLVPESTVEFPDAPVRIFVMGRNEWRDEYHWPLERAVEDRWYLRGGGLLTRADPPPDEQPSEFVYDPGNPVPTVGGHTVMGPGYPAGPMDQRRVEGRVDVLVFTSALLAEDLEVTGRVRVVMHAGSSARSTDWVARLCDVHPDGESFNLCDGIVRVINCPEGYGRYEIDLWSTSNVFLRGHSLRVLVTSSSFPRWDRNLNTGNQGESRHEIAHQRLSHDAGRPSYVQLPVIRTDAE